MNSEISISEIQLGFSRWQDVLNLLHEAFEYQRERIDPPSSLYELDVQTIASKARNERLILAQTGDDIVGCVFVRQEAEVTYLGKFAVSVNQQGQGIGRRLMKAIEACALEHGHETLELETRIELTENHRTFERMGFAIVSEHAHDGYDRTTFVKMRKAI